MLKLHFFNVGNGDSMLVEEFSQEKTFRLLIDAGHDILETSKTSMRMPLAEHLSRLHVHYIDTAIVSHLHIDHFGGLKQALENGVMINALYSPYTAPDLNVELKKDPSYEHSPQECMVRLNAWAQTIQLAQRMGTKVLNLTECSQTLTDALTLDTIIDLKDEFAFQHRVFDALYAGDAVSPEDAYKAAKLLNPVSPRFLVRYKGFTLMQATDCYGYIWEDKAEKCDLLKVPHHGDSRSVTEKNIRACAAQVAVISASNLYNIKKDRPSPAIKDMIRAGGTRLYMTDPMENENPMACELCFSVSDDGQLTYENIM